MPPTIKITSSRSPIIRRFRRGACGDPPEVMVADGVRLVTEALDAEMALVEVAVSPKLRSTEPGRALLDRLSQTATLRHECQDRILARMSFLNSHQGVIALFRRPTWSWEILLAPAPPLVVVAAGIKDPGNLGALLRTAEAAGASGLVALAGGADPFRDKALRGSAGSVFRLPTCGGASSEDVLRLVERGGLTLILAKAGEGGRDYREIDLTRPCAILLGGEIGAVPEQLEQAVAHRARIPMAASVDSLNVAVAAGVLLYEARRQRS